MKSICVFCGSSLGADPAFEASALELGAMLAKQKITLVYGGSKNGIMGATAKSCLENDGQVIGVIPGFLNTREIANTEVTELIRTESMHERKKKMSELAEGFIALPGGFGTLEELCEILTWAQLGLIRNPIGILNINGYYDHLLSLFKQMNTQGLLGTENLDLFVSADNVKGLLSRMQDFIPPTTSFHRKLNLS